MQLELHVPQCGPAIGITRKWESSMLESAYLIGKSVQGVLAKGVYKGIKEPVKFTLRWIHRQTNGRSFLSESQKGDPSS